MVLTLFLGLYVLYRNPQSKINLSFFIFAMTIFLLDFVSYNLGVARTYWLAHLWAILFFAYHWSTVGQYLFILAMTESWSKVWSKFSVYVVYLPALVITVMYFFSNLLFVNLTPTENGWTILMGNGVLPTFSDALMIVWSGIVYVAMYRQAILFYRQSFDPIKKAQMKFLFVGVIIATAVDLLQTVPWVFTDIHVPQTVISGMTVFLALVTFAIIRYDFFAINASTAADTIFSTMTDAVFLLSNDFKIRLVNGAALMMIGQVREKLLGRSMDSLVKMRSGRVLSRVLKVKLRKAAEAKDLEGMLQHDQGESPMSVSMSATYLLSSRGEKRGLVLIVRDISERKVQENRLRSSYQSLKLADKQIRTEVAKLQAILGSVGEGLIVADDDGNIAMANGSAQRMLCWKEEEMLGKNLYKEFVLTNEKREEYPFRAKVEEAISKNKTLRVSLGDLLYISCTKGKRIPVSLSTTAIRLGTTVIGTVTIFENITREVEVDLAKTEFVSLAAHQLVTPLTAIRWNLELAHANKAPHADHTNDSPLTLAYEQTAQMLDLIKQFLNVSRLELGKLSIEPEPVDLEKMIRDQIEQQLLSSQIKKQKLVYKSSKGLPLIPLDPVLARIVVQNLLSNAIKYTPNRGKVTVELRKARGAAELVVTDTGIGIPLAQQKQLFNKLFRAENALAAGTEGNGLGLYLVKSIVGLIKGGDITFTSVEGKGTTFTVTIPFAGMEKREGTRRLAEVRN